MKEVLSESDFQSRFVDVLELDQCSCFKNRFQFDLIMISNYPDLTTVASNAIKLSTNVSTWCKENKIRYKKILVCTAIINTSQIVSSRVGGYRLGLLFATSEKAAAFKLRWS